RGSQTAMTQQQLNGAHVRSGFEQVCCKTVPKGMRGDRFGNPATLMRLLAGYLHRVAADATVDSITRKEPLLGPVNWPPGAEDLQQLWGEHDIAIFLPFTKRHTNDHSFAVDIGDF